MLVMIRKWSVEVGLKEGCTSHLVIKSARRGVLNTLSGLEYRFVTMCCSVGIPFGRVIERSYVASSSISPSAIQVACGVNKWVSLSLSHRGWCLLKSPAQIIW